MQLILSEKPSVARCIAGVVGAGEKKNGYFEGGGYLVGWFIGHLAELAQPEEYKEEWKKWSLGSLPILPEQWKHIVKEDTKGQYEILCQLMNREDVTEITCATDVG